MYKKSIAMLLCALMLSSAFVSCGDSAEVSTGAEDTADTSAVVETVSEEEQKKRIISRNGEAGWPMFRDRWIPMERTYFSSFQIRENCDDSFICQSADDK